MTVEEFLARFERVKKSGSGWTARCPAHEDRQASLSIGEGDEGRVLLKCHAGCTTEEIVSAIGLQVRDLFPSRGEGASYPRATVATVQQPSSGPGCTLAAYASAKGLPVAFLESLGVAEMRYLGAPAVRFPYVDPAGEEVCVRFRVSLDGDVRIRTKAGNKHCLYGLNRLETARELGYVIVVEGESDTQTLWHADYPAIGLPGANGWNEDRDAEHLDGISAVYVLIEPDRGGQAVLTRVGGSSIRERVRLVTLSDAKDVSELCLADRERFSERLEAALQSATPWAEHEQVAAEIRLRTAWSSCALLAHEPKILDAFACDLARSGLAGEARSARLLYLVLTSRFLGRPVSSAVKGPSSGGKSYLVERVSSFFPGDAFYELTAMSEHALAYGTEPLSHRFLILYEAAGLEGDFATLPDPLAPERRTSSLRDGREDRERPRAATDRAGRTDRPDHHDYEGRAPSRERDTPALDPDHGHRAADEGRVACTRRRRRSHGARSLALDRVAGMAGSLRASGGDPVRDPTRRAHSADCGPSPPRLRRAPEPDPRPCATAPDNA